MTIFNATELMYGDVIIYLYKLQERPILALWRSECLVWTMAATESNNQGKANFSWRSI